MGRSDCAGFLAQINIEATNTCRSLAFSCSVRNISSNSLLETRNANRRIPIEDDLAAMLKYQIGNRLFGHVFQMRRVTPAGLNNVIRRVLHPSRYQGHQHRVMRGRLPRSN
jgi:hypothetical protein